MNWFKKLRGGALVSLGYMLSPLSWWHDLFFNLPIALVFGYAASWEDKAMSESLTRDLLAVTKISIRSLPGPAC